jgi:hypothetical protein
LAVVSGTRLCPYYRWRNGNTASSSEWIEAMQEAASWMGVQPWLNRGDIGFSSDEILSWHETSQGRPYYLFKLRLTKNLKRAIYRIKPEDWVGCKTKGLMQTTEITLKLSGWNQERRVIVGRSHIGDIGGANNSEFWEFAKYEYEAYVTNLPANQALSWQVIELYRKRADCENVFDELKNQWGFSGFCSRHREVTETAARLLLLTYNLWNLFLRLLEPNRHVEARHGRKWFLLIAARLTKTSRQRTWKIAVTGEWWAHLKEGYQRVYKWLSLTAPQLENINPHMPITDANTVYI